MEIKAILEKPYTQNQKNDFIIENHRKLNYEIRYTNSGIEAWGYTQEEQIEINKQIKNSQIDDKISELEQMCIPEIVSGNTENILLYRNIIESLKLNKV